jgi:hypothetical protein
MGHWPTQLNEHHCGRHPRESGGPHQSQSWIPAFAGMTGTVTFERAAGDEESRIALKTLRATRRGWLAPLGMTSWTGFSHRLFSPALPDPMVRNAG